MGQGSVWLFAEARTPEFSFKLSSEARKLADRLGAEVCAVLIGYEVDSLVEALGAYGTDRAFVVEDRLLEKYSTEAYTKVLVDLIEEYDPLAVLFGATSTGSDLAPRLAARLSAGLIANCIELDVDREGKLVARKPIHGGNIHATLTTLTRPFMATVDPKVLEPKVVGEAKGPEIVRRKMKLPLGITRTKVIDHLKADPSMVDITEANVVVGVGRGLGRAEHIRAAEELARLLKGTVGGSRVAVDEGWIPYQKQIGVSGKSISPEVYMALGISGAHHHTSGVRNSKLIIAVNRDRNAPMLKMADLGVVGDLHQVVQALIEQLVEKPRAYAQT